MGVERPTFHESWYRVAELRPRLRSTVQVTRQHFRGQSWHVVQDHTNNAFFRLAEPAYAFIGVLDGKRTVAEAWKIVCGELGDEAPTQGEVIQLLGQLYTSNLLQADTTPDTHALFARYKKRKQREITSYLMNILFARLPLVDPDAFLNRWLGALGWIFSPVGLVVWLGLVGTAFYMIAHVTDWQDKVAGGARGILNPENLAYLYVAFACIKACHEMGHAISCKKFGVQSGTGGEVHVIGLMLMIFTPIPYVDASSSWALRNKWHRAMVGAAGMWVEFAIAAVAGMVWANTPEGHWLHSFTYNVMFIASFSTLVFNANPLLRYDGYYILSDLLEIPNLGQRSKEYVYYLVKRYVWGLKQTRNPAFSRSEQAWFFAYAVASFIMRVVVSVSIMIYLITTLNGMLVLLATVMAVAAVVGWVLYPLGKFLRYLVSSPELARNRGRAQATTAVFAAAAIFGVGIIPAPAHGRAQGVVEPVELQELFVEVEGFVRHLDDGLPRDRFNMPLAVASTPLVVAQSPQLEAERKELVAERARLSRQYDLLFAEEVNRSSGAAAGGGAGGANRGQQSSSQLVKDQIATVDEQLRNADQRMALLTMRSAIAGTVVAPDLESRRFAYLQRYEKVGLVAGLDHLLVRAAVANDEAGLLANEADRQVEIRVRGRPDILLSGHIAAIFPAGSQKLPSAALGYAVGGDLATTGEDREGTKTTEHFFEVRIDRLKVLYSPTDLANTALADRPLPLLPGQTVVVRFDFQNKPLVMQAWTKLLQIFHRKLQNG